MSCGGEPEELSFLLKGFSGFGTNGRATALFKWGGEGRWSGSRGVLKNEIEKLCL